MNNGTIPPSPTRATSTSTSSHGSESDDHPNHHNAHDDAHIDRAIAHVLTEIAEEHSQLAHGLPLPLHGNGATAINGTLVHVPGYGLGGPPDVGDAVNRIAGSLSQVVAKLAGLRKMRLRRMARTDRLKYEEGVWKENL